MKASVSIPFDKAVLCETCKHITVADGAMCSFCGGVEIVHVSILLEGWNKAPEANTPEEVLQVVKRSWPNFTLSSLKELDAVAWYKWATSSGRLRFSTFGNPFVGNYVANVREQKEK